MNQPMTQRLVKIMNYWHTNSQRDFDSACDILRKAKRYTHGLFFVHLAIEKALKAVFVKKHNRDAPLTHNLLFLSRENDLQLTTEQLEVLSEINEFNLETRYPEATDKLYLKATESYALRKLAEAEGLLKWILAELEN